MNKRTKPQPGDSFKVGNDVLVVEELFTADSTRWVLCTKLRKKTKVSYNGRKYTFNDTENVYLTEYECIKLNSLKT